MKVTPNNKALTKFGAVVVSAISAVVSSVMAVVVTLVITTPSTNPELIEAAAKVEQARLDMVSAAGDTTLERHQVESYIIVYNAQLLLYKSMLSTS